MATTLQQIPSRRTQRSEVESIGSNDTTEINRSKRERKRSDTASKIYSKSKSQRERPDEDPVFNPLAFMKTHIRNAKELDKFQKKKKKKILGNNTENLTPETEQEVGVGEFIPKWIDETSREQYERYNMLVEALHYPNPPPENYFDPKLWVQAAGGPRSGGLVRGISKGIIVQKVGIEKSQSRRQFVDSHAAFHPVEVDRTLEATLESLRKDNHRLKSKFSKMVKLVNNLLKRKKKGDREAGGSASNEQEDDDADLINFDSSSDE